MKRRMIVAALVGLALVLWLVLHSGVAAVLAAVAAGGLGRLALLTAAVVLVGALLGSGCLARMPKARARDFLTCVSGRQTRDSASDLLPFSHLGGIVIGARAVILRGVSPPLAFASAITDVTTELLAQIVFILIGLVLCVAPLRT